uniref:ATP synthase complex subunit 8 n=2 Tax=Libellulidae TaxID=6964 RepID=A0A4Y5SFX7_9ODON|nr:ATP synthase F0 subunit 8 [Tramea virginia]QDA21701.1 ATP synthase F0 subunit 8 [Orthetrum testaceum]QDA21714.1 ATP synthase F0 subunit 8 [Tramea virginia]WJK72296.1 ATP synthase F0 subunit 8 [Crocothemis servilia servilia]
MPQMAPMSWIMLFLFFSTMLVMINILNYFIYTPKISMMSNNKKITVKTSNWSW